MGSADPDSEQARSRDEADKVRDQCPEPYLKLLAVNADHASAALPCAGDIILRVRVSSWRRWQKAAALVRRSKPPNLCLCRHLAADRAGQCLWLSDDRAERDRSIDTPQSYASYPTRRRLPSVAVSAVVRSLRHRCAVPLSANEPVLLRPSVDKQRLSCSGLMTSETPPEHRNSLGYTINNDARRYEPGAKIVWGQSVDGLFVPISQASSGGQDNLRCDCGSSLIAKKGSQIAHHFAHSAGETVSCQKARVGALSRFANEVIQASPSFRLPATGYGQPLISLMVSETALLDGPVILSCYKASRRLIVYICTSRKQNRYVHSLSHAGGPSAILVDISKFRARDDNTIRLAILDLAPRVWLHNARPPRSRHRDPSQILDIPCPPTSISPNTDAGESGGLIAHTFTPRRLISGDELRARLNEMFPAEDEIARLAIKRDARDRPKRHD